MKAVFTDGVVLKAEDGDNRAALEAFVQKAADGALVLRVAEVTHRSDEPEGPGEIRIDWMPA